MFNPESTQEKLLGEKKKFSENSYAQFAILPKLQFTAISVKIQQRVSINA